MTNEISQLKNTLGIGARANKYRVYFSFPTAVTPMPGIDSKSLSLVCNRCDGFPQSEISSSELWIGGRKLIIPKQAESNGGDWTADFYNDEEHKLRNSFVKWLRAIDHLPTNSSVGVPNTIMTTLRVAQLDSANNETVVYNFYDVFVKSVSAIEFNGTSPADPETFTVTFSYTYFTQGVTNNPDDNNIEDFNNATKNTSAY